MTITPPPDGYLFELRYSGERWSGTMFSETMPPEGEYRNLRRLYEFDPDRFVRVPRAYLAAMERERRLPADFWPEVMRWLGIIKSVTSTRIERNRR